MNRNFNFGAGGRPQQRNIDPVEYRYKWNCMLLEIASNWKYVNILMFKYHNKILGNLSPLSKEWIDFIVNNGLRLDKFAVDIDGFIKAYEK